MSEKKRKKKEERQQEIDEQKREEERIRKENEEILQQVALYINRIIFRFNKFVERSRRQHKRAFINQLKQITLRK